MNVSNKLKFVLFADDTFCIKSCKTTNGVENIISVELNKTFSGCA